MHYERAPRFRRWKLDVAPPPLRCAVQGLRSAAAALGEGTGVVCPAKKLQQGLGKWLENGTLPWGKSKR
jgi:hypothetical protein